MAKFPNPFKVREHGNVEFWISNLVIIVSTVLGVYLAAQAGFRTALQFEEARNDRDGYFMRRSLLDEVKDNLNTADQFVDFIQNKNGWRYQGAPDAYKLQGYVWETMQEQSVTFQLPPAILTAVRRYYDTAQNLAKSLAQGQGTAIEAAKTLAEETKKMRETTIPAMERDIDSLRQRLAARGMSTD
ncbi:MAG: hypothetical protein NW215_00270 [Hyphomicrobiales bacterium]|nr:hypothetical protein [Hyphomicrobiales bacterium]